SWRCNQSWVQRSTHREGRDPRFRTFLLGVFAVMALVLAATGIFGVISYSVAWRKHEIGIRVALGASRGAILGLVSCETLILISAGLFLGGIGALAASRVLGHLLFGVSASDPLTLRVCHDCSGGRCGACCVCSRAPSDER